MKLEDLFVSHTQVQPVKLNFKPIEISDDIYVNLNRAKKATINGQQDDDMSTWTTLGKKDLNSDVLDWSVKSTIKDSKIDESIVTQPKNTLSNPVQEDSWNNPYKNNKSLWKKDLIEAYKKAGLSDNAIKNLLAKNAFESGWGEYAQGAYNFGNITTGSKWSGKYVDGKDKDSDGNSIVNKFRVYDSLDDYVKDEIQFLTNLYDFNVNDDFETFIEKLQGNNSGKRRYAEDNQYATKVRMVYNSI